MFLINQDGGQKMVLADNKIRMTTVVFKSQKNELHEILKQVNEDYNLNLSLSDLMREILDNSLPIFKKDDSWVHKYI